MCSSSLQVEEQQLFPQLLVLLLLHLRVATLMCRWERAQSCKQVDSVE
jgi:hypothetical protein